MTDFVQVCSIEALVKDAGVAALVNAQQIALFYIDSQVYALDNFDPIGEANVLSRGMTGDANGELYVASPLQKERYSLMTGQCLDVEGVQVNVYSSKIEEQYVWVKA